MKSLFVEFYGLPGCGKSTLSHIVADLLRSEGFSVDESSYDIDHRHPLPKRMRKFTVGGFWFVLHHGQYKHVREIVGQNGYRGSEAFKHTVNVIQKMRVYNGRCSAEIVLLDQGLIQSCISLSTNRNGISARENYKKLVSVMPAAGKSTKIYIEVDEKTALDRMSGRATNDSRVEKLKDKDAKLEMLKHIREAIASVREVVGGEEHVIVSSNNLTKDAELVYRLIKRNELRIKNNDYGKEKNCLA